MSRQLYDVVAGPLPTTLTAPYIHGVDTSIMVLDATDIPDAPNIITISDVDDYFITVEYLTKNDTELTDLTFIEGFEEHEFSIGSEVVRAVAKYDFDALKDAIDSSKSFDIVIEGQVLPKVDDKVTLPPSSQGHLGLVKPGNNITILPDGTINATGEVSTDYTLVTNKPQINSVELIGDKSSGDLGLADSDDLQDHIADVSNPHSVTKDQVGLGNVNNTSDLDKPISTATQNALDLKADETELNNKVDKVTGKGLSTNDFTDAYKQKVDDTSGDLSVHIEDMDNPHEVTKSQVGLGNVDNTSDINKPISNAVQTALNGKASTTHASTHFTNGTDAIAPSDIGAPPSNHRSVSDQYGASSNAYYGHAKASSTIPKALASTPNTGVELDSFARGDHVHPLPDNASTSADGLMSSEDKSKLDGIDSGAEANVLEGVQINNTDLTITNKKVNIPIASANDLGLFKVGENLTIDSNGKLSAVVSGAAQSDWTESDIESPAYIKHKPTLGTAASKDVPSSGNASSSQVVLGSDTRLTDSRSPISHASSHYGTGADIIPNATATTNGLMSSNDKTKLNGIEEQAQKNVKSDWTATSGDQQILNKPTALSDFSNDENFQTDTEVAASISTHNSSTTAHTDIRQAISAETSRAEGEEQSLQDQIDGLASRTDVVDVVGTKAELLAYDTSTLLNNDIIKVLVDESQNNAITYYRWVVTGSVGAWVYVGSQGPFYTKSEADGYFVPQQRTVNGKSLANNVTLDADDVNALPYDTTLADLPDDATHRLVTDTQVSSWNAKQGALTFDNTPTASSTNPVTSGGVYTALSGKASSSDLQSHIEDTDNPHGVTKSQVGLGNVNNTSDLDKPISTATQTALNGKVSIVEGKGLSTNDYTTAEKNKLAGIESGAQVNVQANWNATTAETGAIANKPTDVSAFNNDANYQSSTEVSSTVTSAVSAHNTNTSAHSDIRTSINNLSSALDGKVDAETGKGLSTNDFTTALKNKLDGIAAGAEVNVQSDWGQSDTTADDFIKGKPTLGTASAKDVPASGNATSTQVVLGSDTRLTDSRSPTSHASTHATGESDAIAPSDIGAAPTSHASTETTYGVSTASNYGHAKATSATPSDNAASASVGTDNGLYARGDHAHRNPITISTSDPSGGVSGDVWLKYTP